MECYNCKYEQDTPWFDACPNCGIGGMRTTDILKILPDKITIPKEVLIVALTFLAGQIFSRPRNRKRKRPRRKMAA